MLKKILTGVCCAFVYILSSHAANTIQVEITVMANGSTVSAQEVWLNYSDGQSIAGTTLKVITDVQGKAIFQIPTVISPQDTVFLSVPSLNTNVRGRPYMIRDFSGNGIVPLVITPMTWALVQ